MPGSTPISPISNKQLVVTKKDEGDDGEVHSSGIEEEKLENPPHEFYYEPAFYDAKSRYRYKHPPSVEAMRVRGANPNRKYPVPQNSIMRTQSYPIGKMKFFVGGILEVPDAVIEDFFSQYCDKVIDVEHKIDRNTNKRRGFGFVNCYNPDIRHLCGKRHAHNGYEFDVDEVTETKIFVGGLRSTSDYDALLKYFDIYGYLVYAEIARDTSNGNSKQFAFCQFEDPVAAQQAINDEFKKGHFIDGKRVNVRKAESRKRLLTNNAMQMAGAGGLLPLGPGMLGLSGAPPPVNLHHVPNNMGGGRMHSNLTGNSSAGYNNGGSNRNWYNNQSQQHHISGGTGGKFNGYPHNPGKYNSSMGTNRHNNMQEPYVANGVGNPPPPPPPPPSGAAAAAAAATAANGLNGTHGIANINNLLLTNPAAATTAMLQQQLQQQIVQNQMMAAMLQQAQNLQQVVAAAAAVAASQQQQQSTTPNQSSVVSNKLGNTLGSNNANRSNQHSSPSGATATASGSGTGVITLTNPNTATSSRQQHHSSSNSSSNQASSGSAGAALAAVNGLGALTPQQQQLLMQQLIAAAGVASGTSNSGVGLQQSVVPASVTQQQQQQQQLAALQQLSPQQQQQLAAVLAAQQLQQQTSSSLGNNTSGLAITPQHLAQLQQLQQLQQQAAQSNAIFGNSSQGQFAGKF